MKPKKLIVFDMDGVLIDVSGSYRETVRQAVHLFFKGAQGWDRLPAPLFSLADLARVKQSGGLNNDWDLTCRILNLLFESLQAPATGGGENPWAAYQAAVAKIDLTPLIRFWESRPDPLLQLLETGHHSDFVMHFYKGDVGTGNIIKQIFQEIYLGIPLFETTYGFSPQIYPGPGYIDREHLMVEKAFIKDLARDNLLAIATGRPRAEAEYPLAAQSIRDYFTVLLTLNDCLAEEQRLATVGRGNISLSKPHPFLLDTVAARVGAQATKRFFLGDMPDDMIAAARSAYPYCAVGILAAAPDKPALKKELIKAGAAHVLETAADLKKILQAESG